MVPTGRPTTGRPTFVPTMVPTMMPTHAPTGSDGCVSNGQCVDLWSNSPLASSSDCKGWAAVGECQRNPTFMRASCRKSCCPVACPDVPAPGNSCQAKADKDTEGRCLADYCVATSVYNPYAQIFCERTCCDAEAAKAHDCSALQDSDAYNRCNSAYCDNTNRYYPWASQKCARTCCEAAKPKPEPAANAPTVATPPTSRPTAPPTTPPTAAPLTCSTSTSSCEDKSGNCGYWSSNGECTKNPAYMLANCKKSCCPSCATPAIATPVSTPVSQCAPSTGGDRCSVASASCAYWASSGECSRNPAYMQKNCRLACCSQQDGC